MFDRIVHDPAILGGKPCIKGTRISVEFILELIETGGTPETIAAKYPHLKREDVEQAIRYASYMLKNNVVIHTRVAG
jgi:uncharacterized protein (DUF433 family)